VSPISCDPKRLILETNSLYTPDKGLITRVYRELKKLNYLKINEPIKTWATDLNRTFPKEEIQMAKKTNEKMLIISGHKEIQIKTTLRFHLTLVRIAIIKNITNNKFVRI
jgi:hypothetical protein